MIETPVVSRSAPGVDPELRARLAEMLNQNLAGRSDVAVAYCTQLPTNSPSVLAQRCPGFLA